LMTQIATQPAFWKDASGLLIVGCNGLGLRTCFMTTNNAHLSIAAP